MEILFGEKNMTEKKYYRIEKVRFLKYEFDLPRPIKMPAELTYKTYDSIAYIMLTLLCGEPKKIIANKNKEGK